VSYPSTALDATAIAAARVEGVLFDIDDTLVDLRTAAIDGFLAMTASELGQVPVPRLREIAADFADDGAGAYERYMAGELTFLEQRMLRVKRAYAFADSQAPGPEALQSWVRRYEELVQAAWKPFDDVLPHLEVLDALGVPFGAVSNNVEAYQRNKLRLAGLGRIEVVIGSDTAGAPKPHPAPFLAGCAQLGTSPDVTLYVGDNPINDVAGAHAAGLPAVLVDRAARHRNSRSARVENLHQLSLRIRENPRFFAA